MTDHYDDQPRPQRLCVDCMVPMIGPYKLGVFFQPRFHHMQADDSPVCQKPQRRGFDAELENQTSPHTLEGDWSTLCFSFRV